MRDEQVTHTDESPHGCSGSRGGVAMAVGLRWCIRWWRWCLYGRYIFRLYGSTPHSQP